MRPDNSDVGTFFFVLEHYLHDRSSLHVLNKLVKHLKKYGPKIDTERAIVTFEAFPRYFATLIVVVAAVLC